MAASTSASSLMLSGVSLCCVVSASLSLSLSVSLQDLSERLHICMSSNNRNEVSPVTRDHTAVVSLSLSVFLSVSVSLSFSLSLSVSVCLSFSLSVFLSLCLSLSLSFSLSVFLSLCLCLSVFLAPSLPHTLSPSLSPSFSARHTLFRWWWAALTTPSTLSTCPMRRSDPSPCTRRNTVRIMLFSAILCYTVLYSDLL